MKFAHIADTHIRNLKYHKEYREVFSQLYEKIREEQVDCIVHCGDIAHTKTQISPEFVEMCTNFFRNLADLAPTYIILGNHDGNLKNSNRQDALTPIVEAMGHPNLKLLKNSGEMNLTEEHENFKTYKEVTGIEYVFNVLSVFDEENWTKISNPQAVNIALYHGSISNCKTDLNWVMEHGEHTLDIFKEFDYAMLGDIHKRQSLDKEGRICYAGSTVQQNHGETNDKGFLIWEIKNKESFNVKHVELKNPKPFLTIELTPKGKIPRGTRIAEGARLRLVSNNNLPLEAIRKAAEVAKRRFKPEAVTFLNRAAGNRGSVEELADNMLKEDLRDPVVQRELIDEYLKDYQVDTEVMDRVYDLNKKYNSIIEKDEEVARNVNWKLLSVEWDNLFNYGEGNRIDFEDLSGIVGILGKNFSGKSSIIDSFLFSLFNSTSKNSRKNLNVINQTKNEGRGKVEILVNGRVYTIERTTEKYVKRLKGEETLEAKTDVDFKYINEMGEIISQNGLSRNDTDKNIRKVFGTVDDFLLTSMTSQHGSLSFISEGSTKRKEILAKFLDLEFFEKKFKMANEEGADLKGALKRFEGVTFAEEIAETTQQLEENESLTQMKKKECGNLQFDIEVLKGENELINEKLKRIPAEIIDISELRTKLPQSQETLRQLKDANRSVIIECQQKKKQYNKIVAFVSDFDIKAYNTKQEEIDKKKEKVSALYELLDKQNTDRQTFETKVSLLSEVPCGEEYSHCRFIKDAYRAKLELPTLLKQVGINQSLSADLAIELTALDPEIVENHLTKYTQVIQKRDTLANEVAQCQLTIDKNKAQIIALEGEIRELERQQLLYQVHKEAIENYSELKLESEKNGNHIANLQDRLTECEELLQQLYISNGVHVERVENLVRQKEDLQNLREEYEAYDLYMRCMHPNGISYDIIKKRLPVINEEIAKILANVVDFEIFFEEDGNRMNIFIKHPKYGGRPLEMASGAEKSIAAMAIRLALLNVSTLPKPDLFILDEPGTSLDEENMEGFVRILDLVKSYFSTVLLISHLDSLKDSVDKQIVIETKNGFAHVGV